MEADPHGRDLAGASYVQHGDFALNPEHPPLVKLWVGAWLGDAFRVPPTPALREKQDEREFVETTMYRDNDDRAAQARTRAAMWSLHAILLLVLAGLLWRAFGAAWAAGTMAWLAIDPSVGAYLPVVMTDLPVALTLAIAALATNHGDPFDYLEVIGRGRPLLHAPLPVVAIPTTAGTGSEVTRNAVLTSPAHGVKVSLRSPLMFPRVAIVDPELTYDLPPSLTAMTGLDALTQLIEPYLAPDGVLVGLQNGMNDEAIAALVGMKRTLGCVVELSAEVFTPGLVQRNTTRATTWFGFGELDGSISPRLREIESMMTCTAKISVTPNITGAKWTKLVNSSMILSVFGMLGLQSWQATEIPEVFDLCIRVGRETVAVGAALGLQLEPIFGFTAEQMLGSTDETVEKLLRAVLGHLGPNARKARGVILQDYLKGRRTEVECLTGVVVDKGRMTGVPTPANGAVAFVNGEIRAGRLQPSPSNLAVVEAMLRQGAERV
jgi:2-dehydropantoate 2-reductase